MSRGLRKFTHAQVRRMRDQYAAGDKISDMAREWKIRANAVKCICHGKAYKDVEGPIPPMRPSGKPAMPRALLEVPGP